MGAKTDHAKYRRRILEIETTETAHQAGILFELISDFADSVVINAFGGAHECGDRIAEDNYAWLGASYVFTRHDVVGRITRP
jgi:hypothetical protein